MTSSRTAMSIYIAAWFRINAQYFCISYKTEMAIRKIKIKVICRLLFKSVSDFFVGEFLWCYLSRVYLVESCNETTSVEAKDMASSGCVVCNIKIYIHTVLMFRLGSVQVEIMWTE